MFFSFYLYLIDFQIRVKAGIAAEFPKDPSYIYLLLYGFFF